MKTTATVGTHAAMWLNLFGALFGALSSVDLTPLGHSAGYVMLGVTAANAALHAFTGNTPIAGNT